MQDLKKEGAQWLRGLASNTFLANLGDFLRNFGQRGVGVRPLRTPLWIRACIFNLIKLILIMLIIVAFSTDQIRDSEGSTGPINNTIASDALGLKA